jgi:hypothetical protein
MKPSDVLEAARVDPWRKGEVGDILYDHGTEAAYREAIRIAVNACLPMREALRDLLAITEPDEWAATEEEQAKIENARSLLAIIEGI